VTPQAALRVETVNRHPVPCNEGRVVSFVTALFFIGDDMGDTLWRIGVATLFIDTVSLMLWPARVPDRS
jgi:hypothetical protein